MDLLNKMIVSDSLSEEEMDQVHRRGLRERELQRIGKIKREREIHSQIKRHTATEKGTESDTEIETERDTVWDHR